jgi:hypothetical protein
MHRRLPPVAWVLGPLGLLPFIGCALAALSLPEPAAATWLTPLAAYGAVILAFLGGVHWGFVLAPGDAPPQRPGLRLLLGVLPSLIGWVALLTPLLLPAEAGLAVLLAGFVATILTEQYLARNAMAPAAYMPLRWVLSVGVVLVLLVTLALRLLGAKIML